MLLLRATTRIGFYTLISRILGFVRDVILASLFGAGMVMDAFIIAFRLPNLFRRFFAEGALNAAFVPLFTREIEQNGMEKARHFAARILSLLLTILILLTTIIEIFMPYIVFLLAPGFGQDEEKLTLTITLSRLMFPYLLCISIAALYGAMLNSIGRFTAAAAAPLTLNVILIAILIFLATYMQNEPRNEWNEGMSLAWGVAIAGVIQLVFLLIAAYRAKILVLPKRHKIGHGVKRFIRLGIPGFIAAGIVQINLIIGQIIASQQESAVSWLYYADRVYQLPLGMIGIAVGVALLPELSRHFSNQNPSKAQFSLNRALEFALFLTIPATIAFIVIAEPIMSGLFQRGNFSQNDAYAAARALIAFAPGLPAFVMVKIFSPVFFARRDTITPTLYAAIGIGVNITVSLSLFPFIGYIAIGIATSLAAWVNTALLAIALFNKKDFIPDHTLRSTCIYTLIASAIMGIGLLAIYQLYQHLYFVTNMVGQELRISLVVILILFGIVVFFATSYWLNATLFKNIINAFRRK